MSNKYQLLEDLEQSRKSGTISEEEYRRERENILNSPLSPNNSGSDLLGMDQNSYLLVMHLSQFAGLIIVGLGFVVPLILWLINKDKNKEVDKHGKNILNFMISWLIYYAIAFILIISIVLLVVGLPIIIILAISQLIFIIIASVKASSGEYWEYPLSIRFFGTSDNTDIKKRQ